MSIVPLHSESTGGTAVGIALGDAVEVGTTEGTAVGIALGTVDGAAVTTEGQKLCVNQ
jgi:hypothetical protein